MSSRTFPAPSDALTPPVATGFDLEPLPNGDVLIEFFGDNGETFNVQVITRTALARFPAVVHAFFLAVGQGQDAALEFLDRLNAEQHKTHGGDDGTNMRSGCDR